MRQGSWLPLPTSRYNVVFFRLGIGVSQTRNHTQTNGRDANASAFSTDLPHLSLSDVGLPWVTVAVWGPGHRSYAADAVANSGAAWLANNSWEMRSGRRHLIAPTPTMRFPGLKRVPGSLSEVVQLRQSSDHFGMNTPLFGLGLTI